MSAAYYNTTHQSGAALRKRQANAKTQQDVIADYYRKYPYLRFSPSQIQRATGLDAPITSIRRAITNLANADLLVKTTDMVEGAFGAPEHQWQWRIKQLSLLAEFQCPRK